MPKLMEHRLDVVETHQRRLALSRTRYVHDVDDHGQLMEQTRLRDQGVHPSSTSLGIPLEVVGIEQSDRLAILADHVEHPNRRMPHGQIRPLLEIDPIEFVVRIKHAVFQHALEFKIRLDRALIDLVLFGPYFLGIVLPIPSLRRACQPILLHRFGDQCRLGFDLLENPWYQILQHLHGRLGGAGHLVLQSERSVIAVAEQLSPSRAELGQLQDDWLVVDPRIFPQRAIRTGQPDASSQFAILERCQNWLPGGIGDGQQVLTVLPPRTGRLLGSRNLPVAHPSELSEVIDQDGSLLGHGQQLVLKLGCEG